MDIRFPYPWHCFVGTLLLVGGSTLRATEPDSPPAPTEAEPAQAAVPREVAPEQITQWIAQLDADRFDTRQQAQQKLEALGEPALAAVAELAREGTLESSTRAINILLNWAESPEQSFRLATLEKLVNLPNRPRESAMATRLLAEVREQAALEKLEKLGAKVTQVGGYSSLEIRIDKDWKGGDGKLKLLAEVRRPASITFSAAPVTEAAILEHVAKVPQAYVVLIYGTPFSEQAKAKLQQQLPNTQVESRDGAMLGILGSKTDPIKDSVAVTDVVENGAAHKAGILPGDRITHLDGEKLTDFDSLTERIGDKEKYKAGDSAKLTLLRNGKTKEVTVTFDLWGETDNTKLLLQKSRRVPRQLPLRRMPTQGLPIPVPRR